MGAGGVDEALIHQSQQRAADHIHPQDVRILIKAGCLDSIGGRTSRAALMWEAVRFFDQKEEEKTPTLFDYVQSRPSPSARGQYSKSLMLRHESETLGLLLSAHPLERYSPILRGRNHVPARDLRDWVGKQVTTIGWLITGKTVRTKEGDPMKFISFEDTTDIYETVFFPKVYHRFCHMLNGARHYILKGKVEEDFATIYGFAHGGFFTVMSPTVAELFGIGSHGAIFDIVLFSGMIGGAIGPLLTGRFFDVTGSYKTVFIVLIGVAISGLVLITLLRPLQEAPNKTDADDGL